MRFKFFKHLKASRWILSMAIVLVVPIAILTHIQYLSLTELRDKTRVVAEENLNEALKSYSRTLEEKLTARTGELLAAVSAAYSTGDPIRDTAPILSEIKRSNPEVEEIFLVSEYSCKKNDFVFFHDLGGTRYIDESAMTTDAAVTSIGKFYKAALSAHPSPITSKPSILFRQDLCLSCPNQAPNSLAFYGFLRLTDRDSGGYCGYAGVKLNDEYLRKQLVPSVMREHAERDQLLKESEIALLVQDEKQADLARTADDTGNIEVSSSLSPIFGYWHVGAGYQNNSVDALAQGNFVKSLALTAVVLLALVASVLLTLVGIAREVRLADAKSSFVANVTHELKTPLSLIRLFSETLELDRVESKEKAFEYYRIINRESQRLTMLIDKVLDFGRIEAGQKEYRFVLTDVTKVVTDVMATYEEHLLAKGFEVKKDFEHGLNSEVDRDALSQAVINLIDNAVKYSAGEKELTVSVKQVSNYIEIEVADRGIGIPHGEKERIFEKFYRIENGLVHNVRGSGLGLSLSKHIVEAHKGHIRVESKVNTGSRFSIFLPIGPAVR